MKASRLLTSMAVSMLVATGLHAGGNGPGAIISVNNTSGPAVSGGHGAAVANTGGARVSAAPINHASVAANPRAAIAAQPAGVGNLRPIGTRNPRPVAGPMWTQTGAVPTRPSPIAPAARAHNAWTDVAADNRPPGQHLYPDTTHNALGNPYPTSGRGDHGTHWGRRHPFRFHGRGYYSPYVYGYPGVLVGGYSPYIYGETAGIADTVVPDTVAESNQPSPEAQNELARPYPSARTTLPAGDSKVNPPDQSVQPGNGPDSLVEAVQAELSRRGYFGGKIDAIYNAATHTAIQRFQTDQKLPASGRINEATLHALDLD